MIDSRATMIQRLYLPAFCIALVITQTLWFLFSRNELSNESLLQQANCCEQKWTNDGGFLPPATSVPVQRRPQRPIIRSNQLLHSTTTGNHTPTDQRVVLSFTVVPTEIDQLVQLVRRLLIQPRYSIFDAIHLCVPWIPMRREGDASFGTTESLLQAFPSSPRIILLRLPDLGPMTRYIGPLQYEQHPYTRIVVFDIDALNMDFQFSADEDMVENYSGDLFNIPRLVHASLFIDPDAVWCNFGHDMSYRQNKMSTEWHSYQAVKATTLKWNHVHICRAVQGLLIQPRFFNNFWYNQTDYHESCFWDDDRWVSFQFERQNISRKEAHALSWNDSYVAPTSKRTATLRRRLGTLSRMNLQVNPDKNCVPAWLNQHPESFPDARQISSGD